MIIKKILFIDIKIRNLIIYVVNVFVLFYSVNI